MVGLWCLGAISNVSPSTPCVGRKSGPPGTFGAARAAPRWLRGVRGVTSAFGTQGDTGNVPRAAAGTAGVLHTSWGNCPDCYPLLDTLDTCRGVTMVHNTPRNISAIMGPFEFMTSDTFMVWSTLRNTSRASDLLGLIIVTEAATDWNILTAFVTFRHIIIIIAEALWDTFMASINVGTCWVMLIVHFMFTVIIFTLDILCSIVPCNTFTNIFIIQ